jgi:hypothetical protein
MTTERPSATLDSVFQSGADFIDVYDDSDPPGVFFHHVIDDSDLPRRAQPGALVSVRIEFIDRNAEFRVHARVVERVAEGDQHGVLLEFLPEEESRKQLVLACAEGDSFDYEHRESARYKCLLSVDVGRTNGDVFAGTAAEISSKGVRLSIGAPLTVGEMVQLTLSFPSGMLFAVSSRVASVITEGPDRGAGFEFVFETEKQREEMNAQVARLRWGGNARRRR